MGCRLNAKRTYQRFAHKGANFRICCDQITAVTDEIVRQRRLLEEYIREHGRFATSLEPLAVAHDAPEVARRMARAAAAVGVGPMAAVAGTMAQLAAEAALSSGADEVIVENGGDTYLVCRRPLVMGLYAGPGPLADQLAFAIAPEMTPLAICSSSGTLGHSMSLGHCDLATVAAGDASLADAAATLAANLVRTAADIDAALGQITAIGGVAGVMLVKDGRIGLAGDLPELAPNRDAEMKLKITRDPRSA